jgi:P-type Ca2+ transporter type 2C
MTQLNKTEGLNDAAVRAARTLHGYNEIPQPARRGAARLIGEVVREPMFLLLLSAAGIYLLIGSLDEGLLLAGFALLSIGLTVFQEHRSERALQALRELATPTVRVIRAGALRRIPARELVPGDCMFLDEGERVAADAIVRQGIGITVDESLLTGESVPVRKRSSDRQPDLATSRPGGDDSPVVYAGTLICSGHGQAEVLSIGAATEMGRIGKAIDQVDVAATPLQQSLRALILRFAFLALGVSLVLFLWYGLSRGDWLQGALSALALGMAMLPEEFPMAFTILLALAAWQLAQRKVLARRPVVLQTLGGVTLLCVEAGRWFELPTDRAWHTQGAAGSGSRARPTH